MRCGNWRTNHGESKRMYPARQTKSTLCSFNSPATSRSCSSRDLPCDGITAAPDPGAVRSRFLLRRACWKSPPRSAPPESSPRPHFSRSPQSSIRARKAESPDFSWRCSAQAIKARSGFTTERTNPDGFGSGSVRIFSQSCHSEARHYRARNLLFPPARKQIPRR